MGSLLDMKGDKDLRVLSSRFEYPGFKFEFWTEYGIPFMRVKCPEATDNVTGKPISWNGRKWRLSWHMTEMEVANTCFLAVTTALEHEARELFKVDGVAIMDSHRDLAQVIEFMKTGGGHARPHLQGD